MSRGDLIANEAMEWIDTPFVWQQSVKGKGCDCKMLPAGCARELGFPEANSFYATVANYSDQRRVPSKLLRQGLAELFDQVAFDPMEVRRAEIPAELKRGDLLLLSMAKDPNHLAIVVSDHTAVHAKIGSRAKVTETGIAVLLRKYRLAGVYRWKEM